MSDFSFVKGDDVVIRLDGEILGGVIKLVCSTQNSYKKIEEFLTDIPVAKIAECSYGILMTMNSKFDNLFENSCLFDSIEISDKSKTVIYSYCHVDSVESTINAKGIIEYKVKITAESREVK